MIHIIIPVHNRVKLSKKCLSSLDNQIHQDWIVYFVNDGSTDGTSEWLSKMDRPDVECINGDGSLWWTGSTNKGVKQALKACSKEDYIMTLNNDLVFHDNNALFLLLNAIALNNKSICGSISIEDSEVETIMSSGSKMISWFLNISHHPFVGRLYSDIKDESLKEVDMLTGRSVVYPVSAFDNNSFDSVNFPHYGGDSEFTARAKRMGYKLFLVPKSAVYVMREETGLNPMDRCLTFREKILSLFSIRSVSNLMIRTRFAWKVPPIYARPTYFIVSMIKIFSQLLIGNYIAKRNKY